MSRLFKAFLGGLCVILFIAAFSSGSPIIYFLFSMVMVIMVLSFALIRLYERNLFVVHSINSKILHSGENLSVDYRVYNSSYLPMLNVGIEFDIDKKIKWSTSLKEVASIGIQDYLPFEKKFVCPYRGYYDVGKVIVTLYDPLMLHKRVVIYQKPIEVIVRPQIKKLRLPSFEAKDAYGTLKSDKKSINDETNIANIRPYERGDALKNIHWKLSARNDELLTKVYDETVLSRMVIVLDAYKGNFEIGMSLALEEEMVTFCLSLIYNLVQKGMRVKLVYHSREAVTVDVDTMGDLDKVSDLLTHFESLGNQSLATVLGNIAYTDRVLAITPIATKELTYFLSNNSELEMFTFSKTFQLSPNTAFCWIDDVMDVTYEN